MHVDADGSDTDDGYHRPVLVDEVLSLLEPERGGLVLDGTVGGGGHARALLEGGSRVRLVAADRDSQALAESEQTLAPFGDRVRLVRSDFRHVVRDAGLGEGTLSAALLDLGVSSHQLDSDARGFAFRRGLQLDMRMDPEGSAGVTAADVLNEYDERRLSRIFWDLAEERRARTLAREVARRRKSKPFQTSDDLVAALATALGKAPTARDKARIFQALRMEVNGEIQALEDGLDSIREALAPEGRVAVISYHSIEDRIVKNRFRDWSRECVCPPGLPVCGCRGRALGEVLTRRPTRPKEREVERNPRARSARLRAWRKAS